MKKIDCPLCGAKEVIFYNEGTTETDIHPNSESEPKIGSYKINHSVGSGYDWSHADICPKLEKVTKPRPLFEYYVTKDPSPILSDFFTFEDYQAFFQLDGFRIIPQVFRSGGKWRYALDIRAIGSEKDVLLRSASDSMDRAFELLRHRLLCGQIVDSGKLRFQLHSTNERVKLIQI